MKLRSIVSVFSMSLFLAGCQSMGPTEDDSTANVLGPETAPKVEVVTVEPPAPPPEDLWVRIRQQLQWHTLHNAQIGKARDQFLAQRNYLPVVAGRAEPYLYYIVEEVEKRGMPIEIALLPMVESSYNPFAVSSQRAAGLWQIMPATGRWLGLEQNWWYDGRRDLRDSTATALDYLEALHREFDDDWLLALAAYNSGKGRVRRAQTANRDKGLATDYWSLKLPSETRRYVPKLIALSALVAYPETFGVEIPPIANSPTFTVIKTGGQIEMARAASLADMDMTTLRAYNAGQLRWATSPEQPDELLVPNPLADRMVAGIATLTDADRVSWQHYKIQQGDSLIRIARKFDTEVGLLRQVNHINGSLIRAGKTMMIPIGSSWESSLAMAGSGEPQATGYRVRRGDSLYRIAGKFNVTINEIITWNSLKRDAYLQPGQKLTLWVTET
ncbi:MAG: transglycosylase SLT domain-containing protein [Proteobacteria bacterium]|nr:transglycosylase SLT domain-containing protein [Pseudomonadota bacterium]